LANPFSGETPSLLSPRWPGQSSPHTRVETKVATQIIAKKQLFFLLCAIIYLPRHFGSKTSRNKKPAHRK
jgi:type VI protein secretion system component VasF